jgi:hypothetical protein
MTKSSQTRLSILLRTPSPGFEVDRNKALPPSPVPPAFAQQCTLILIRAPQLSTNTGMRIIYCKTCSA